MGWFWATPSDQTGKPSHQHQPSPDASHPPGCPVLPNSSNQQSSCPVPADSPFRAPISSPPVDDEPTHTHTSERSTLSRLNPLNYMFSHISQARAPDQTVDLPIEREISSIPRGDSEGGKWEYPSPQQMYNALLRKGYTDTPQDAVESMVAVHNFLNEGAWQEIVDWEEVFANGLKSGWEKCRRGSENVALMLEKERQRKECSVESQPQLVRFMGRPQDRTPKASILQALGWIYPTKFGTEPPFDRHDWYVVRQTPSGPKEIRYVIDYYSGDPEPTGEPVFYLDIRPAIDSPTAAAERLLRWGGDSWWRASGGAAREQSQS